MALDPQTLKMLELLTQPKYVIPLSLLSIWALAWKGVALWKAARNSQKNWFIALLMLNTIGILEIVYIFYFQAREGKKLNDKSQV